MGRAAEVELFRQAVEGPDPPFGVLWLHGSGGVGKSTLLRRLADEAVVAGRTPVLLDARSLDLSPEGLERAFAAAASHADGAGGAGGAGGTAGRDGGGGIVLLVDTVELLAPHDDLLRTRLLPGLPAGTLVVVGGRTPPSGGLAERPRLARGAALGRPAEP